MIESYTNWPGDTSPPQIGERAGAAFEANGRESRSAPRSTALDVLRFLRGFLLVLVRHLPPIPQDLPRIVRAPLSFLYEGGWTGVDLFFVLSGFLISGLLFQEYQRYGFIDLKRFFIRRGLRIYPPFFFLIVATGGVAVANHWNRPWRRIAAEVLFIQDYFPGLWGQTWSLAVEEHFYLVLPVVLIGLTRVSRNRADPFRALPGIYVCLALAALLMRIAVAAKASFTFLDPNTFVYALLFPTHLRIDSLFLGVLIGYAHHYHQARLKNWVGAHARSLGLLCLLLLLPNFIWPLMNTPYHYTIGFTLTAGAYAGVILLSVGHGWPLGRAGKGVAGLLAYMGARPYSIYLWHLTVLLLLETIFRSAPATPWWVLAFLYTVGSLLVGLLMSGAIEVPVSIVRDRCFPSRSRSLACKRSGSIVTTCDDEALSRATG